MSARDSESGSSSYRGGSGNAGGLGNGGVGGGSGGGHRGGGAGYNGGIGSRTGLTSGKDWRGNSAFGRAGGPVQAYGTRDARSLGRAGMGPTVGTYSNFRTPNGAAMFGNSPAQGRGMGFHGMNMGQALSQARRADAAWQGAPAPEGLLGGTPAPAASYPAVEQEMALPTNPPSFVNNPFVDKPATLADYVRSVVKSYQGLNPAPAAEPVGSPPPASALPNASWFRTNAAINAPNVSGGAYDARFSPDRNTLGTRSLNTTEGGYPTLRSKDTRPAGLY